MFAKLNKPIHVPLFILQRWLTAFLVFCRFNDINGLKYVLNRELDAIVNLRESLIQKMTEIDKLMKNPTAELVEQAGNCSKCDHTQKGPMCAICEADQVYQVGV